MRQLMSLMHMSLGECLRFPRENSWWRNIIHDIFFLTFCKLVIVLVVCVVWLNFLYFYVKITSSGRSNSIVRARPFLSGKIYLCHLKLFLWGSLFLDLYFLMNLSFISKSNYSVLLTAMCEKLYVFEGEIGAGRYAILLGLLKNLSWYKCVIRTWFAKFDGIANFLLVCFSKWSSCLENL